MGARSKVSSATVNKLVRMFYLLLCKDPELSEDVKRLMDLVQNELERRKKIKLVMKITPGNEWKDIQAAA